MARRNTLSLGKKALLQQERRTLFLAALGAWACVMLGIGNAPLAHAGNSSAHLAVSATVAAKCGVNSQVMDANRIDVPGALQLACSQNAQPPMVEHGAQRTYTSSTFNGEVMVATINF
ncbi:MAG TPA: hypothetical protein VHM19_13350 [Polyangiales bacterium]|jgi:hypothetical protein|nr:hypothetical protein [Polyangiales bacterium]